MYNREIETSADAKRQHNENQARVASERLKTVAAKVKLKRQQKAKE